MSERFVTTSPDGSRDTLYERRSALSRDLLGDSQDGPSGMRTRLRRKTSAPQETRKPSRVKPRVPEMALGVLLIVGGAFTATTLGGKRTATIQVVAAARDVERGRMIEAPDLIAITVESRFAQPMIPASDAAMAVGRVPVTDIPAGTPVMSSMLRMAPLLADGQEVVALRIEVGDVPTTIGVGDKVRVVLVPDPSLSVDTAPTEFDQPATVWDVVEPSETNTDYVVSLAVPQEFLAKAALAGRSKIALVAETEDKLP